MPKQPWITVTAQAALACGVLVGGVLMLGPFQGAERHLMLSDKEAHAIAFFLFTLLAVLAAPQLRKNDIAVVALALAAASEVAQGMVGRSAALSDLLADAVGIFAVWAPMQAADFRLSIIRRLRSADAGDPHLNYGRRAGDRRLPQTTRSRLVA